MPYIPSDLREEFRLRLETLCYPIHELTPPGVINYLFTKILLHWKPQVRYSDINEIMGVLECIKQEFYRKVAIPFEDKKCITNGEVYKEEK